MSINNLWSAYVIIISILLTGYYLFIAFRFYRREIMGILKLGNLRHGHATLKMEHPSYPATFDQNPVEKEETKVHHRNPEPDGDHPPPWQNEELFRQVEELSAELKKLVADSNGSKEELIRQIRLKIAEFPSLRSTPFQFAINNLIEIECQRNGSIHLDTDDKAMIWQQVD